MALRFQDKDDEVDRAAKLGWRVPVVVFVVMAAIVGVFAWVSGKSLHSYEQNIAVGIACFWAWWILLPVYWEFRARTKEIDGKVSTIEERVAASAISYADVSRKLSEIDEKLDAIRRESSRRVE